MNIQLANKVISNPETVSFVMQCLNQVGGFPGVDKMLAKRGLQGVAKQILELVNTTNKNDDKDLILKDIESSTLKHVCAAAIDTLEYYEDLSNVMNRDKDIADQILSTL